MYIAVINHLGGDYVTSYWDDNYMDDIEETRRIRLDSDTVIGVFDTEEEAWQAISEYHCDYLGEGEDE